MVHTTNISLKISFVIVRSGRVKGGRVFDEEDGKVFLIDLRNSQSNY